LFASWRGCLLLAATAVLPLPWAALAMIAQRKPNNDKGFEDLNRYSPEFGLILIR
jgi:hypothetical protein